MHATPYLTPSHALPTITHMLSHSFPVRSHTISYHTVTHSVPSLDPKPCVDVHLKQCPAVGEWLVVVADFEV